MDIKDISRFQNKQIESVSKIGAFVTCLESFLKTLDTNANELVEIRKLQPIVGEFIAWSGELHKFLKENHYVAYYKPIGTSANSISNLLAYQTIPSKRLPNQRFKEGIESSKNLISETMIAIAQIVSSPIDVNLVAGNSFSAYCFISALIKTSRTELYIIDPYLDKTIFYRYLSELNKDLTIKLISDSRKLKGNKLLEFESVEQLFEIEFQNYSRKMHNNLHDRYLINEVKAYSLGGSIIHAAYKSDFSVIEISSDKRGEILNKYA